MPISIVLTLQTERPTSMPAMMGAANHALTLKRLGEADPALSAHLHDPDSAKPITCSGILNPEHERMRNGRVTLSPGQAYWVRVTSLTDIVTEALQYSLIDNPPARWPLVTGRCASSM